MAIKLSRKLTKRRFTKRKTNKEFKQHKISWEESRIKEANALPK